MRVLIRTQQVHRDLEDDATRKRLRDVINRMSSARPGETLADVIAGQAMRERNARGKEAFEHLFKHGTHDPDQDKLFQKPKVETEPLRQRIMEIVPEHGSVIRWTLWEATVALHPDWNNEDRQELLNEAVEELIAAGKLSESSHMDYSRPPPKVKQTGLGEFS